MVWFPKKFEKKIKIVGAVLDLPANQQSHLQHLEQIGCAD